MIPNSNFGAEVAAPAVRQIYDDIYGLEGHKAALPGGKLPHGLPEGLRQRVYHRPGGLRGLLMSLGTRDYTSPRTPSFGQKRRSLLIRALAKDSPLRKYDWVLLVAVVGLSLIGTLLVYSATQPSADPRSYLIKQLINVALGLILLVAVSLLDYRQIRLLAPFVYAAAVLGLVGGAQPAGHQRERGQGLDQPARRLPGGALGVRQDRAGPGHRGGLRRTAGQRPDPRARGTPPGCWPLALIPVALVEREPALGVIILLLLMTSGMIALSGLRLRWVAALAAAGVLAVAGGVQAAPAAQLPAGPADRVPASGGGPDRGPGTRRSTPRS